MERWVLGVVAAALMTLQAQSAQARPRHQGFTGDLGIGLAVTMRPVFSESCSSVTGCTSSTRHEGEWGFAPLSLSLGGWVSPKVALIARFAGTSYFKSGNQIGHNFYGAGVEVWPVDALYLSGGIGFALYGPNPLFSQSSVSLKSGWALDFRVGAALAQGTNHDFTLSLEAIPGFYERDTVTGLALVGAWKWY